MRTGVHSLESWGATILSDLAAENYLKGLEPAKLVIRLTRHYGEINYWHAFRDGNGRATKEFLYQLAKEAGYTIEFHRVRAPTWNEAAARQMAGDALMAVQVFEKITSPSRAIAFRDKPILCGSRGR